MSAVDDLVAGLVVSGIALTGPKGERGEQGPKGERGSDGERGPAGPSGRDGSDGRNGSDGRDGTHGRDGIDGQAGQQGSSGLAGARGKPGRDGPPGPHPIRSIPERDQAGRIAFVAQLLTDGSDRRLAVRRDAIGRFSELVEVPA